MGTSNLNRLITSISLPDDSDIDSQKVSKIQDHRCNSSSSTTPIAIKFNSQEDQTKIKEVANSVSGGLKIQIPFSSSSREFIKGRDDPKTPTSTVNRIPVTTTCPPAPKKVKRVMTSGKRKALFFPGVAGDFMVYVDAMLAFNKAVYVPDIVVGDLGAGNRVKKRLKALPPPAHDSSSLGFN